MRKISSPWRRDQLCLRRPPAALFVAGALIALGTIAAALALSERENPDPHARLGARDDITVPRERTDDRLRAMLAACRDAGRDVADPLCRAAWDANRRRFFGDDAASTSPADRAPSTLPLGSPLDPYLDRK